MLVKRELTDLVTGKGPRALAWQATSRNLDRMGRDELRNFPEWFKVIVNRICEAKGTTRQELADSLGVHIHSVSTAGYRGQIGLALVEQLARMAKVSPAEMGAIELAWFEMRSQHTGGITLRRAVDMIE